MFGAAAVGLTLVLVGSPFVTGRVYSQADNLFVEFPWAAHRPPGFPGPNNTLLGDVPQLFVPFLSYAREAVRSGRLPLWNPLIFGGQPFLGAIQTALFSPFTWLAYVIPLPDALTWIYLARVLVPGLGMFVLLGAVGVSPRARLFGALAWLLAPFTIVWLGHPVSEVSAWLPWMVWATWRTTRRGWPRDIALLGLFTAAALFAGHPETLFKVVLLCAVFAIAFTHARWSETDDVSDGTPATTRWRGLLRVVIGIVLGLAVAAVQVLPALEYIAESRSLAARRAASANVYVVPPETVVTAIVPNFLGHPVGATYLPMQNRYGLASNYAEQQVYPGVVVWLLAAVGVWARRRDPVTWWIVLAMTGAAALMYGLPGLSTVASHLPGFSVLVWSRFGLVITFGAVWLAVGGVDALVRDPGRARGANRLAWLTGLAMLALTVASLAFLHRALVAHAHWTTTLAWCAWALALLAIGLLLIELRRREVVGARAFTGVVTGLSCIDLLVFGWGFQPTVDRALVFPRLPEIDVVRNDPGVFRVAGWRRSLLPDAGIVYGVSDIRGYDGIAPRTWSEVLDTAMPSGQFHEPTDARAYRLFDLLNVRYVFAPPDAVFPSDRFSRVNAGPAPLWRNEHAFPRAFLAPHFVVSSGAAQTLGLIAREDVNLRTTVVLEEWPETGRGPGAGGWGGASLGTASITTYSAELVEVITEAPERRLLVLSDLYYPGWETTVDDRPARLLRADHALRAVPVAAGRHVVRLLYRPRAFRVGGWITTIAALIALLALWWTPRRTRRPGKK